MTQLKSERWVGHKSEHKWRYNGEGAIVDLLKTCGKQRDIQKGSRIHVDIAESGWLEKSCYVASAVVNMYAKCGALENAQKVLHALPDRDVVTWNALLAGYIQQGKGEEALICIDKMQREGLSPNAVTFACALRACGNMKALDKGEQIHKEIVRQQLLENNIILANALVDMYARCGTLEKARQVLNELPVRNAITWTALMAGFIQQGKAEEVLSCLDRMRSEGISPDGITFACALQACGSMRALDKGEQIHEEIVKLQLLQNDIILGTALVDMYAKCGVLEKAQQVLQKLSVQDIVSWNALFVGFIQHGRGEEVLSSVEHIQQKGLTPDVVTFACALQACGSIGAVDKGVQIHKEISKQQLLKNVRLGNILVDMYAKCGALEKARQVLHELPARDVVSWTTLISGYMQQGKSKEVMIYFDQMEQEGYSPNAITFLCVLNACSHSGLLGKGQMYFGKMSAKYGLIPGMEHHSCMVDLFGRAGEFDKALALIRSTPYCEEDLFRWHAVLGACWKWRNVEVGRLAFKHAIQIDKRVAALYILMSNIYAAAGMYEDANKIEDMRVKNKAWKGDEQDVEA